MLPGGEIVYTGSRETDTEDNVSCVETTVGPGPGPSPSPSPSPTDEPSPGPTPSPTDEPSPSPSGDPGVDPVPSPGADTGKLPLTGPPLLGLVAAALVLVGSGLVTLRTVRRKR